MSVITESSSASPSRMGVHGDTLTLHFRNADKLEHAKALLPSTLADHPLTVADAHSAMPRLFIPLVDGQNYRNLLASMGTSPEALNAMMPHIDAALAAQRSPEALARAAMQGLEIQGGEHFSAAHQPALANSPAEALPAPMPGTQRC